MNGGTGGDWEDYGQAQGHHVRISDGPSHASETIQIVEASHLTNWYLSASTCPPVIPSSNLPLCVGILKLMSTFLICYVSPS